MTTEKTVDDADDEQGTDPADAFGALSDPLRVNILQTLAAHHRETEDGEFIGFAELRRRVDVRDSGRFRYHVERLRGRFVEKTGEGYRLTYAGVEVVAAILMGTYTEQVSKGPEDLDSVCFVCDEPAMATYDSLLQSQD
jgi:DNA-binding transcriptional ArsR family regulator